MNTTNTMNNSIPFISPFRFHFGIPSYKLADVMQSMDFPTPCAEEVFNTVEGFEDHMFDDEFETDARGYETQVATVSREGLDWIRSSPEAASAAAWILAESPKTARLVAALFMKAHSFCRRAA